MFDLSMMNEYFVLVVVGVCLCVGYVIKQSLDFIPNKYIPLIMAVLGIILNIWVDGRIDIEILLAGMFSGLASTGLYETFRNMINKEAK